MKARLQLRNGYWSWSLGDQSRSGYTCPTCAYRAASAATKVQSEKEGQQELYELRLKYLAYEYPFLASDHLPPAKENRIDDLLEPVEPQVGHEQMNAIPTIGQYADYVTTGPLKTALDHEGPYFPQRRNWFQRLLDRF